MESSASVASSSSEEEDAPQDIVRIFIIPVYTLRTGTRSSEAS